MTLTRSTGRLRIVAALCATAMLMVASLATAPPSDASICQKFQLSANCRIVFGGDKSDGDGGSGGGSARPLCNLGKPDYDSVDCYSAFGLWSNDDQCYVQVAEVQPDPKDPEYRPHGKYYDCMGEDEDGERYLKEQVWSRHAPDTEVRGDLQADLEQALDISFRPMQIGIAPTPMPQNARWDDGWRMAPVGLDVWMWPREPNDSTWGPVSIDDEETGYYVNARVDHVVWDMGDGTQIPCGKSTPYMPYMGWHRTPSCGHKYTEPGTYQVSVRTYWKIDYRDATGEGNTELDFHQSLNVRIGENQVVSK